VRFVSFNYDTLLESACRTALGIGLDSIDAYVERTDYRVYKPHGSVNWAHVVENEGSRNGASDQAIIGLGKDLRLIANDYRINGLLDTIHYELNKPSFPAIASPVESKADFEAPANHLTAMQEDLRSATKVLIVGWRATEQHFLKLWTKEPPFGQLRAIGIVAGRGETEAVQKNLGDVGIGTGKLGLSFPSKWYPFDGGFSYFLGTDGLLDQFLAE
jgi:hypothetical protein